MNSTSKALRNSIITVGSFDGIHKGHQSIIRSLVTAAHKTQKQAIVFTFFPNPTVFLRKINSPYYLTTQEEKNNLLKDLGVDHIITLTFNEALSQTEPEKFIQDIFNQNNFESIFIGHDFRFGIGRKGDVQTLNQLSAELGFSVCIQKPVSKNNVVISSTHIRELISQGDVKQAALLLGRSYSIQGKVVHGDGRGKKIGLPTANIQIWPQKLLPIQGVYAANVTIEGNKYSGIVNIGVRPTFYKKRVKQATEVHVLDFDEQIYDCDIKLEFIQFLRPENKYENAQALMLQIQKDIQQTREIIKA